MLYDAKQMSDAIRMKRKKMKKDGVENAVDTAPGPQMNAQDIHNTKLQAQIEETIDVPPKSEAPSDPADAELDETQKLTALKKKMSRLSGILSRLSVG